MNDLVVVAGPTASGKSELALRIAEEFCGEIVNCDSLQVYRRFDIGTAKLPASERRGIPHHLVDIVDPDELFTAGEYARRARAVLEEIARRGRLPVLAGGTGFYIRALLEGLFPGPERDPRLRRRLAGRESRHPGWLHRTLGRFDPQTASRVHAADVQKLIRVVEILLATRTPPSQAFSEGRTALEGYRVLKLALNPPRDALYRRINIRSERMFEAGLVEEVRSILSMGYPATVKPFESVGYRQALQVVQGDLAAAEAVLQAQQATRNYAKRQWTWFRRDPEIVWLDGFGEEARIASIAIDLIKSFLHSNFLSRK